MYNTRIKTKKFDTDNKEHMEQYDSILSNPLCSVINSWKEKITDSEFDEGKLVRTITKLVLVVTWEEKSLL